MLELNEGLGQRQTLFVEVILPLAISKTYTYRVPASLNEQVQIGKRVIVQFGKSKIYTAIICSVSENPPALYEAKYIIEVLDEYPIVNHLQLKLWEWISDYYMCNAGEVMQAAMPAALKLASETKIILLPQHEFSKQELTDKEYLIVDALEIQPELKVSDISKLLGQKTVFPVLKGLFDKGIIHISEEISERYKPRYKSFIQLSDFYNDPVNKKHLFDELGRAPKQLEALLAYIKLSRNNPKISKAEILEESNCGDAAINALIKKGVFIKEDIQVSRLLSLEQENSEEFELNKVQQEVFDSINQQFSDKDVVLLHGVTASGKTQIYIRLIEQAIQSGRNVLYLLPEIALTTHIIERLRKHFGSSIGIYHSKFNDNERAEVWNKVLKDEYKVILGVRSSIFLPFNNLGLIIVDEEHESSYKQFDPAPRYHARDSAIYMASLHKAKVLLGSATPSLESYSNAVAGKYGFAEVLTRFGSARLPQIEVVNIEEETKRKTIQYNFTSVLVKEITDALAKKEQVILFQNRRGYTPFLLCRTCGFSPKCINCDVSLTYHKSTGKLHCHYCGYKQEVISVCPACGSTHIEQKGYGTEKIEDDLSFIFPDAKIGRLDFDATRSKNSFQKILGDFEEKKIDVLVGTQMVAKGLDFNDVTVIGIINADSLLNYPDFRAFERSFQLLAQVAGRAGRRDKAGKVIIQAYNSKHRILDQVIRNDYQEFFQTEMAERKNFQYPPFYRLIQLDVKHKDFVRLNAIADKLAVELRQLFGDRILGPEAPLISKIRNYFIKTVIIKVERSGVSIQKIKQALREALLKFESDKAQKGVLIQIDVDPY
ncbi:replication restart helicase PriA [Rubrolithibacter danxiaensis]|uniref:replication restart helicase PriA n=1 Tax=Rubrolithibacter danxiaensis TaxID=3390805 RepID=UPI003BF8CE9A